MTAFALPPLSTSLVSGEVAIGEDMQVFTGVDLTAWAAAFLAAVQEMSVPAELGALLVDAIAPRLRPVPAGEEGVPAEEVERFRAALGADLGSAYAGIAFYPPAPIVAGQSAAGPPAPTSLAEALAWSYRCEIVPAREAGDELLLSVLLNDAPALPPAVPVDLTGNPLFEALARFVAAPEGRADLIGDVARAWAGWTAPPVGAPPPAQPATWDYRIDFGPAPALRVSRSPGAPWPEIEGFAAPDDDGLYRPAKPLSEGPALAFTFADLPVATVRSAHAAASGRRISSPVPEGAIANPAFVYATLWVGPGAPVAPLIHLPHPLPAGAGAATLSAALDDLFSPLPALPLRVGAAYQFRPAGGGPDQPLASSMAVVLAEGDVPAAINAQFVAALIDWHAATMPSDAGASLHLAVTLFADAGGTTLPLVRLDDIEIAVPEGRPDWWA